MATVQLAGDRITDWDSFHTESAAAFGFPDFYGRSMDAWVDCLSYLRDEDGMCKFRLKPKEVLTIEISHSAELHQRLPELVEDVECCGTAINDRCEDYGEPPVIALVWK